jgi:hypothetical protein
MSDQPFSWSRKGASARARDLIAALLVIDIQQSPDWARDLFAKTADVKAGVLPSWERIGNAYRRYISAEGGLIEDRIDATGPPQHFPFEALEAAVTAWWKPSAQLTPGSCRLPVPR